MRPTHELKEFIAIAKIDSLCFEDTNLTPDERGDKAYHLLAEAMEKSGRVAFAEMVSYGKERLVLIRPAKGGLVAEGVRISSQEIELGRGLLEKLSSENFEPENYKDEYRNRVLAIIEWVSVGFRHTQNMLAQIGEHQIVADRRDGE